MDVDLSPAFRWHLMPTPNQDLALVINPNLQYGSVAKEDGMRVLMTRYDTPRKSCVKGSCVLSFLEDR